MPITLPENEPCEHQDQGGFVVRERPIEQCPDGVWLAAVEITAPACRVCGSGEWYETFGKKCESAEEAQVEIRTVVALAHHMINREDGNA